MRPKHHFLSIGAVCALSMFQLGCHKNSSPAPAHTCKFTAVTATTGGQTRQYDISFDDDSRPITIKGSGNAGPSFVTSFVYKPNQVISSTIFAGNTTPTTTDTVFLENGRVASISGSGSNGNYFTNTFTYDAQGQLTQSESIFNGVTTNFSTYQVSDGDITGGNAGGDDFSYTYYPDKAATIFDGLAIEEWLTYGVVIRKNRHLVKSFQTANISQSFTYNTDDKGNITDVMVTGDANHPSGTYHYTYDCN